MEKTINECFFQIQNGANIKQGDVEGGFPITRIETTANDKFNRDRMGYAGITDISKYEAYVLEDGDLLMSHINSVQYLGRTVLYVKQPDEIIIHGMNLLRLKARRNIINPAYARYCFYGHTFRCQIGNITKKSVNQASFAVKDLKQIKIEVPSLDVQNKVVVILDRVQKIIDMRNNELASLDDLIKARFVEMFGSIHDGKFEMKTLPEIVRNDKNSIKRGPFGGALKKDDFVDEGYLVYEQRHAIHNDFDYAKYYITQEKYEDMIGFKVVPGDLIISCSGVTLGRIAEVPNGAKAGIINQALLKLSLNQELMMNTFFIQQFRGEEIQEILFGFSRGSGIPNMPSMSEVKAVKFVCPPLEMQKQYCDFVHQVDKSKVIKLSN